MKNLLVAFFVVVFGMVLLGGCGNKKNDIMSSLAPEAPTPSLAILETPEDVEIPSKTVNTKKVHSVETPEPAQTLLTR